jgi:L-ascorbate metabolism protein UlaG (beta-lactamase superfamily)
MSILKMAKVNFKFLVTSSTLLWSLLILSPSQSLAMEIKWYGTGCLSITDGDSVLIFDPFLTRPNLWKVLTNQKLESNKELVQEVFGRYKIKKHIGLFITHNHYDHILDLPNTLELLENPPVVVPSETAKILRAKKVPKEVIQIANEEEGYYKVGKFKIKAYAVEHSKLPLNISFAEGTMEENPVWPLGAFDMKAKENFSYHIQHPNGDILYHPTAQPYNYPISKVHTLIVGLTSPFITELKEQVINKIHHHQLISVHNDNFFRPFKAPLEKMPFYPTLGEKLSGLLPKSYTIESDSPALNTQEISQESNL